MRFLVVDGDVGQGQALGHTLERLGHFALVVSFVGEVPESLSVDDIDAVLLGIETPAISGLELAQEVAVRAPRLPIGFLAGHVTDPALVRQAAILGPVLPARWTDADVISVVDRCARKCALRPAQAHPTFGEGTPLPRRRVNVRCSSWDKLARLCCGRARIRVTAHHGLEPGERVAVSLAIPDEIVLAIDGEVKDLHDELALIDLTGLTNELAGELLRLCRERIRPG